MASGNHWKAQLSIDDEKFLMSIGIDPGLQAQLLKKQIINAGYWICSKCGKLLLRNENNFAKCNAMNDGMRPECNQCRKNKHHRETIILKKNDPCWHRAKYLSYNTRWRAKTQKVPVDKEFAEAQNLYLILRKITHCECCGKELVIDFVDESFWEDRLNLDKIVPSKGYVLGNVAWLCGKCNRIKLNATPDEVKVVANWMQSVWPPSA